MSFSKKILPALFCLLLINTTEGFAKNPPLGFESTEHILAGNDVRLFFSPDTASEPGDRLPLPNGLQLTYGELVSMGDFYGVIDKPISSGKTADERAAIFLAAFNSMAQDKTSVTEMSNILTIINSEQDSLAEGIKQGKKPADIYSKIANENNRRWNCATGGGCDATWFLHPGRYLTLTKQDFDHFGTNAWLAYQAGHQVALATAINAHAKHDLQQLKLAYAMNGFACHFLSDRFASGHMRTPRVELPATVTPADIGSLLASRMHNEENKFGLHVHNLRGDHWIAFGDKYYLDAMNHENRVLLNQALQQSADEIFSAYQSGITPEQDTVADFIPQPDEINNLGTQDIAPLFYWDEATHTLYQRKDVNNPFNREWTAQWWGWLTLILLSKNDPLTVEQQAQLANSSFVDQAMKEDLITDKTILQIIRK